MPRRARVVVPGYPHHITQRGVRGQETFRHRGDYVAYLELLRERMERVSVEIWAYCLMPNHVHVVAVPREAKDLAALFGCLHKHYAARFNLANGYTGHLWQQRFYSVVLDEEHLMAAVRYVELNPVRAGIRGRPQDWRWSSAYSRLNNLPDPVLSRGPMQERVPNWAQYLQQEGDPEVEQSLRFSTRTGWPEGSNAFLDRMERLTGCRMRRSKPGPKTS